MTEFSLEGKVAVVIGASRGIGRAIALRFAQAGARVVVSSRKLEGVQAVADEIEAAGGDALALQAHVGQPDDVAALAAQTVETFGRVDIAVNNAATNPHFGPLLSADEGQVDKTLDVNLKGVFRGCKAVAPHMEKQGGGKIINIASVAGLRPGPGMGIYSISKAGVLMLTQVLAIELGPANIQVNAIAPGVIKTRFSQVLWQTPEIAGSALRSLPAGRFGEPEEVASLALYLASPASDYVTGAVFVMDGGQSVAATVV
ncbi:MAG: glucose 1-dehydrogenase [Anaerolineae bacterium]|jgi:NAD(P)-dependent dehydrogenase (short-subunit alcohol dehydrogenase family)